MQVQPQVSISALPRPGPYQVRWTFVAASIVGGSLLRALAAALPLFYGWMELELVRNLRQASRAWEQGVLAPIVGMGTNRHWSESGVHRATVYRYVLAHRPERTYGHETYKRFNQPLISDGRLAVLAAVNSDPHVLLKHNGSPLVLPAAPVGPA